MKILLAGPGTGKTTKIISTINEEYANAESILVLSFTNATIDVLTEKLKEITKVKCFTLHSYALLINHLVHNHIIDRKYEEPILKTFSKSSELEFKNLCYLLQSITFDGMIESCSEFLKSNPAYGAEKIGSLDLLIVDEFQDFNEVERNFVYQLANYAKDTIVLGDDDQSIYEFKDADPVGIIELFNDPGIEKMSHENICYRCPDIIVEHARRLILKNKQRIDKSWKTNDKEGELIIEQIGSQEKTAAYIVEQIQKIIRSRETERRILVLSPVRYYAESIIDKLKEQNIDYVNFWPERLSQIDMINIWWLRAIFTSKKLLNMFFIANATFTKYMKKKFNKVLRETLQVGINEDKFIKTTVSMFPEPFRNYLIDMPAVDKFLEINDEFEPFREFLRRENLEKTLETMIREYSPPQKFNPSAVNIMSIHKSKGLEAEHVFITGLVEGVLPRKPHGVDAIESQRRHLFVGMTRALKSLHIISQVEWDMDVVHKLDLAQFIYSPQKKLYLGKASTFISEMRQ